MKALVVALVVGLSVVGCGHHEQSSSREGSGVAPNYMGVNAGQVAFEIGCAHFKKGIVIGNLQHTYGRCSLGGYDVTVRTFSSPGQQARWDVVNTEHSDMFRHEKFWAEVPGAVVDGGGYIASEARNKAIALMAAKVIHGAVAHSRPGAPRI